MTSSILHSRDFLLHLQERQGYDRPVLIKEAAYEFATTAQIKQLHHEYAITRRLADVPGVRAVYAKEGSESHPVLLLEYIQGQSVRELIQRVSLDLNQKLQLAVNIAGALSRIHEQKVMHRDICSSNILVNDDGASSSQDGVYIIDFGVATTAKQEEPKKQVSAEITTDSLAYISPEQTGRMNRLVDYRTDLYSLGVTLYELFTNQLPFETDDALEMIHCHLAQMPTPLPKMNADIPQPLSDIILRLLAKNAGDRYQSAHGLQADLQICLDQLQATGRIESFEQGREDFAGRLQISHKLYGRQGEMAQLINTVGRTAQGSVELLLIAGYAGVGKTSLIHELSKTIIAERGTFIEGKFDQYQQNVPYFAWGQAFAEMVSAWLSESETSLATRRKIILESVGNNGQVLVDVIPSLEQVIGPQPPVPQLGGVEAKNRFNHFFRLFVKAITSPNYPLAIFLDDLQWSDLASLSLLETLLSDPESRRLLVIGAYRDNEVDATHPLMLSLDGLKKTGYTINQLTLRNLTLEHINELLSDSMRLPPDQCLPLAALIHEKTDGNAFFTHQFLRSLEADGLLIFDQSDRTWRWDLTELNKLTSSANVIDLIVNKILRLPAASLEALTIAACLGNQFELATFNLVTGLTPESSHQALQPAYDEAFLIQLNGSCKFTHDRIQQAVYSRITEQEKASLHRRIGQTWFNKTTPQILDEHLLDIVRHLNLGVGLIETEAERFELAELNFEAAQKAKNTAAYATAGEYAKTAIGLFAANGWQAHYLLTLKLHELAAEIEYLNLDYEKSAHYIAVVLTKALSLIDRVPSHITQIHMYSAENLASEAIETGLAVLEEMGLPLLESEPAGVSVKAISELSPMTDPWASAAVEILNSLLLPIYNARPGLLPRLIYTALRLILNSGLHPSSCTIVTAYAMLVWSEDIDRAYQFGELALQLVEKLKADRYMCQVKGILEVYLFAWKFHYQTVERGLRNSHQIGLETGDKTYALAALRQASYLNVFLRDRLDQAQENLTQNIRLLQQGSDKINLLSVLVWTQFVVNLRGRSDDPLYFEGPVFDEASDLSPAQAAKQYQPTYFLHLLKLILYYHLGFFQAAFEYSEKAEPLLPNFRSHYLIPLLPFYQSLAILQLSNGQGQPSMVVEKLEQNLQKLQLWAQHAPMNHQHKVDLILAEKARVAGDVAAAVDHYEAAITGAREYEYIHEEALANELYGRFWDQRGNEAIARLYLREAHALYENWGAAAIVDHLETQYPQWLKVKLTDTGPLRPSTDTREQQADLDLQTVLKASQAIAGEIKLNKLLSRLMKIVIENAGAQRGFLILEQDDQWLIEAFTEVGDSNPQVMQAISITENNLLSAGIVQYVARTQETVVLEDAARNGVFVNDPYIQRHQVKSLLCWPLVNLGKTSGILYVENNLATGVFTPERLELLNLLSSQIAISIDQARIHNSLERLVVERTQALSYTEAQIHALFETSPLGIAMTTLEGQILFTNQALLQMIGYKEIEAQELNVTSLYHDPEQRFEFLERLQASGIMRDFGIKVVRKDGTSFYASLNASTLSLPDQDVFLAVLEDVSEKILTEKALNEANKNLISLLEISRTMTVASDLESLLDLILEQLDDLIEYSGAVVWIKEEDVLEVRASRTAEGTNTLVGFRLAVDVLPIVGEMLIVKEPIVIDDISDAMALIKELESALGLSLQEYALPGTSLIAFPINAKDQKTGAIAMWKHEPGYFSRENVSLLQGFANQTAIAIDNALLYQEVQQVAVIEERDRLARELHDAVTQTIFSASVIAKAVPDIWKKDPVAGRSYLEQLPMLLKGALAEMRALLLELRPSAIRGQTMGQLLEMLVEAARARSGLIVTLKVEGDRPLPEDVTMALHRIAQESLNNIAKHAEARDVDVRLICDPKEVVLHIADNGCGFDPETISFGHLGVGIMRERAQKIGATFQVDSKPGDGTIVTVSWSDQA